MLDTFVESNLGLPPENLLRLVIVAERPREVAIVPPLEGRLEVNSEPSDDLLGHVEDRYLPPVPEVDHLPNAFIRHRREDRSRDDVRDVCEVPRLTPIAVDCWAPPLRGGLRKRGDHLVGPSSRPVYGEVPHAGDRRAVSFVA